MQEWNEQDISILSEWLRGQVDYLARQLFRSLEEAQAPQDIETAKRLWADIMAATFPEHCPIPNRTVCLPTCPFWIDAKCHYETLSLSQPDEDKARSN
jgi:hypothetical protein